MLWVRYFINSSIIYEKLILEMVFKFSISACFVDDLFCATLQVVKVPL